MLVCAHVHVCVSMCICVRKHVCGCVCVVCLSMCAFVYAWVCIYAHVCVSMCVCVCVYKYVYLCECMCVCVSVWYVNCAYVYVFIHVCVSVCERVLRVYVNSTTSIQISEETATSTQTLLKLNSAGDSGKAARKQTESVQREHSTEQET